MLYVSACSDETQFRNCIVWLEDQKIRHYKIEDRGNLRNIPSSDWPKAYQKVMTVSIAPEKPSVRLLPKELLYYCTTCLTCLCSTCRMSAVRLEFRRGRRLWTGYWAWLCAMNMETMVGCQHAALFQMMALKSFNFLSQLAFVADVPCAATVL